MDISKIIEVGSKAFELWQPIFKARLDLMETVATGVMSNMQDRLEALQELEATWSGTSATSGGSSTTSAASTTSTASASSSSKTGNTNVDTKEMFFRLLMEELSN